MQKIMTFLILLILLIGDIIYTPICLANKDGNKDVQSRQLKFNAPPHWTKTPGFWPEGSYSFLKYKGNEERLLIFVRTSAFTKAVEERIAEDTKILRDRKKLTVISPPKPVKLGALRWTFIEASGTVKNIWNKPEQLYRLQYYTKEKDILIEAYLEAMGKSFDAEDRKEFENFLASIKSYN